MKAVLSVFDVLAIKAMADVFAIVEIIAEAILEIVAVKGFKSVFFF